MDEPIITIRPLAKNDKDEMARLANNKKIWNNVRDALPYPYTIDDAVAFIKHAKQYFPVQHFAVLYNGYFSGVIGLTQQADIYRRSVEIGYWIGEPYWNKGVATTAVNLLTYHAFHELKYARIFAGVFANNPASMKVLEKNNYILEAVLRKNIFKNDKFYDEYRYARLHPEL